MSVERITRALLAVTTATLISTVSGCGAASEIQSIPPASQIIDVRTPREFASWHFPGAINIPVRDLERRLRELDTDRNIIVYCRSGSRSSTAKKILMANGYTNVKNGGGLSDMKRFLNNREVAAQK